MNEPQIIIVVPERRRGGRPRAFNEPGTSVSTWVPASDHDRLIKQANAREMSVSTYVRYLISRAVASPKIRG